MPCATCGGVAPADTPINTLFAPIHIGAEGGTIRKVRAVVDFDGLPAGRVAFVDGDGLTAALAAGHLTQM